MAVLVIKDEQVPKKKKMSQNFVCYKKRRMTDTNAFGMLLLIICFIGIILFGHYWDNRQRRLNHFNSSVQINDSWNNFTHTNLPSEEIYNISQLADTIARTLKTEKVIGDFDVWQLGSIVTIVTVLYTCSHIFVIALKIMFKGFCDTEHFVHLSIINAIRMIVSIIFIFGINFRPNESWNLSHQLTDWLSYKVEPFSMFLIMCALLQILLYIIIFSLKDETDDESQRNTFKAIIINKFRFYNACRYLVLFRCLILTIMILFLYLIMNSKVLLLKVKEAECLFAILGSMYLISFLHGYGRLIIIVATASHDWDQPENVVSFATLLSAIAIVTRYHLGNILNGPFSFLIGMSAWPISLGEEIEIVENHYSLSDILKLIRMFTAVLGQDSLLAIRSVEQLREKDQPQLNFKNKLLEIWVPVLIGSSSLWLIFAFQSVQNVEAFKTKLIITFVHFAILGTVSYIITAFGIIENTIEFCQIENFVLKKDDYMFEFEEEDSDCSDECIPRRNSI